MSKKLIIFDGSNFYHKSKRLAPEVHLTYFNYRRLAEIICGAKENLTNDQLKSIGFEIVDTTKSGARKLEIIAHKLPAYEQLIMDKLNNGFWNDIIGLDKITFIFKFKDGAIKKFNLSPENQAEIAQLCHEFNGDPMEKTSDLLKYLSENSFYTEAIKAYQNRG